MFKFLAGFFTCYLLVSGLRAFEVYSRGQPLESSLVHGLAWGARDIAAVVAPDHVGDWSFVK